jgi:hypothetical protein
MQVLGIKAVLNFSILAYLILEAVKNLMGSNKYQN